MGVKQGFTRGHRDRDQDSKLDLIPEPPLLTALLSKTLMRMISHSRLHEPEHPEGHKRPICSLRSPTTSQSLRFFQPWRISAPNAQPQCACSGILNTARTTLSWVQIRRSQTDPEEESLLLSVAPYTTHRWSGSSQQSRDKGSGPNSVTVLL